MLQYQEENPGAVKEKGGKRKKVKEEEGSEEGAFLYACVGVCART
jgi:hypothetical protein